MSTRPMFCVHSARMLHSRQSMAPSPAYRLWRAPPPRKRSTQPRPCRAQSGGFYDSKIVQQESERIMHDFESLSKMMSRYHEFDVGGKRIYLEKWDELVERLQIFNTRAKLSDDPMVKEYLTSLSRQLLFMSTNLDSVYQGLVATVKEMRELLEAEEKIVDPGELQLFRRQLAQQMSTSSKTQEVLAKNLTMEKMMQNPAAMQALVTNPKALLAVQDIATTGPGAIEKYKDQPDLYAALRNLFDL